VHVVGEAVDLHDHVDRGVDLVAQRLERAQQHRQALALDRLADEHDPQRLAILVADVPPERERHVGDELPAGRPRHAGRV
jgi:hypothetical protein